MSDYQAARDHVEAAFLRAELEAVPGGWHLVWWNDGILAAKDGKCCASSPVLLGRTSRSGFLAGKAAGLLGVPLAWVNGVLNGFDSSLPLSSSDLAFVDGYEWGYYMRRYIKP